MSEELELSPEVGGEPEVKPEERDFVTEAKTMGWKEDFDGPDKLDPKEFVLRKPLYDEMKKLKRKTKELETALRTQAQMQNQLLEKEKQEVLNTYKTAKMTAIEEGDARKVVEIDEEIEKIRNTPVQQAGPNPAFVEWAAANDWYVDDEDMQAWADSYGLKQHKNNPQRPVSEIYAEISRKVKEVFPHKFSNPNRSKAPDVTTSETQRKATSDEPTIPKDYKQVFFTMWRSGAWGEMTQKDAMKRYAEDLKKVGAI